MGFSGPPSEPDVRLSPHPALRVLMPSACLCPSVQLRLHRKYPRLGLNRAGPRSAGVHQRPPRLASKLRAHWTPSPCARLSRAQTTTGPPPHFAGIDRRQVFPTLMAGTDEVVPTFTLEPFDGVGAQLCPCNLATATPQSFTVASRPTTFTGPGVPQPAEASRVHAATQPISVRFELVDCLEELSATGSSRTPFRLACRTRAI